MWASAPGCTWGLWGCDSADFGGGVTEFGEDGFGLLADGRDRPHWGLEGVEGHGREDSAHLAAGEIDIPPAVATSELRVIGELGDGVEVAIGDIGPFETIGDLGAGIWKEGLFDQRFEDGAIDAAVGDGVEAGVVNPLGMFDDDRAEIGPVLIGLDSQQDLIAIAAGVGAVGDHGRMTDTGAGRGVIAVHCEVERVSHPLAEGVEER